MKATIEPANKTAERPGIAAGTAPNPPASTGRAEENRLFSASLFVIILMSAMLYVLLSLYWPKFSRAEVFFAECAREMIAASNYVTPLYHGEAFFDKPILVYWFIIGCFKTFGVTHFAARIPSIVASLATLALTAWACRQLFGVQAALLATMVLATSVMYLSFSALCMSDSWLVLIDTVTLVLLYAGLKAEPCRSRRGGPEAGGTQAVAVLEPGAGETPALPAQSQGKAPPALGRTTLWLLAAASMGIGFLTKGPITVVLPSAFFIAYLFIEGKLSAVKPRMVILGALAMCLIASPWFFMAYAQNGIESMAYFFIRENVHRFTGAVYDTHKPIWFMVVSLMGGFLPWSIFLPPMLYLSAKRVLAGRAVRKDPVASAHLYLWLWTAVVIGFFSVSHGKIDYYALPVFPACAILTGYYLDLWIKNRNKWAKIAACLLNVALIVAGIGLGLFLHVLPVPSVIPPVIAALVPIIMGVNGLICVLKKQMFMSYATVFSGIVATGSIFAVTAMPVMMQMHPAIKYAATIKADSLQTGRIGMYLGLEHWVDEVTFRTAREPVKLATEQDLLAFMHDRGQHWLMIRNSDLDTLSQTTRDRLVVVNRHGFIPKSINPGYILRQKGDLTGGSELILARTR